MSILTHQTYRSKVIRHLYVGVAIIVLIHNLLRLFGDTSADDSP